MDQSQPVVLACIDGSKAAEAVCDYSAWVSNKVEAPVTLLHSVSHHYVPVVTDLSGSIGLGAQDELLEELTQIEQQRSKLLLKKGNIMLDAAAARVENNTTQPLKRLQRHGSLQETLLDFESETRILVMGIRGSKHDDVQDGIGHKLESVIRQLHRPILVVNQDFVTPKKIMLAFDGSDAATKALDMIVNSPLFKDMECHVVYAEGKASDAEACLALAKTRLDEVGIAATVAHLDCALDAAISEYQEKNDIDMLVMGAYSHGRLRDLIWGSMTSKLLANSARPLLLLR